MTVGKSAHEYCVISKVQFWVVSIAVPVRASVCRIIRFAELPPGVNSLGGIALMCALAERPRSHKPCGRGAGAGRNEMRELHESTTTR